MPQSDNLQTSLMAAVPPCYVVMGAVAILHYIPPILIDESRITDACTRHNS